MGSLRTPSMRRDAGRTVERLAFPFPFSYDFEDRIAIWCRKGQGGGAAG